jgi:hypothetical protein
MDSECQPEEMHVLSQGLLQSNEGRPIVSRSPRCRLVKDSMHALFRSLQATGIYPFQLPGDRASLPEKRLCTSEVFWRIDTESGFLLGDVYGDAVTMPERAELFQ